ncbi:18215_t:CDS:2 [Dentiscutata erythropus]|uniref:18215_t:CDS:1 n=1 Tax=Dentiscutata erythropus TaxID=1348616 RepID=A0A9N8W5T6_9GLOM|nr:18215_t:CDS:2 [Dentiscutata erythropus]
MPLKLFGIYVFFLKIILSAYIKFAKEFFEASNIELGDVICILDQ